MIRVAHVISSFRPVIGGAERATETLCHALRAQGVDAVVLTRRYSADLPAFERIRGIPVYRLGIPGRGKIHGLSFIVDVVRVLGTRLNGYRIVHIQNIDAPALAGLGARLLLRRRMVATIHGEAPIIERRAGLLGRLRVRCLARFVERITTINPENARLLEEVGVPLERQASIPNGIDMQVYRPATAEERQMARDALGLSQDSVVVLYLGRLVPFKRVDLLIDAWQKVRSDRARVLLIVGEGPTSHALREQAIRLGSDARFDGPTQDSSSYLRAADIFVLPSGDHDLRQYEGLSVALLEAMAAGLTPVVTEGPGNDVLVPDATSGLRFPIGDLEALTARLEQAIGDPELRASIGPRAHERVRDRYADDVVARKMITLYCDVEGAG